MNHPGFAIPFLVVIAMLVACPVIAMLIGRYRTSCHILVRKAYMRIALPIMVGYFGALAVIYTIVYANWFAGRGESPLNVIGCGVVLLGPIAAIVIVVLGERQRARHNVTHCAQCGYDRTGLPADRACPECGAAVKAN